MINISFRLYGSIPELPIKFILVELLRCLYLVGIIPCAVIQELMIRHRTQVDGVVLGGCIESYI